MKKLIKTINGQSCEVYAIASEAFAHFFNASALNNKVKLDIIKSVFPNSYKEFIRMVGVI